MRNRYHLAIVIGGLSADMTVKAVKYASTRYLDTLPTEGNFHGVGFRDLETEAKIQKMCHDMGIGAQFGGRLVLILLIAIAIAPIHYLCP